MKRLVVCVLILDVVSNGFLLFPETTVLQLTIGLSIPVILPNRTIVVSQGIQNNFDLPFNVTNFQVKTYAVTRSSEESFDISRDMLYQYFIAILDNFGLNGEECLLRSVCEASNVPFYFDESESLLEKIAHHVFTPSIEYEDRSLMDREFDPTLELSDKLLVAEAIGKTKKKRCANIYFECPVSIIDLFSAKFHG